MSVGEREIGDDLLLGDVDDEARPFFEFRPVGLHDVGYVELDQRIDRDVDGHPQIDAELGEIEAGACSACARASSESVIRLDSLAPGMNALGISTP